MVHMTDCKLIPCPWSANALRAYARGSLPAMHQIFQKQAAAQQQRIRRFGANESRALFQRLRSEGMKSTALGFDFTALHRAAGATRPQDLLTYSPVKRGLELLVFPTAAITGAKHDHRVNEVLWQCDQVARGRCVRSGRDHIARGPRSALQQQKQDFARDGFLKVDNWGLDMTVLAAQAETALRKAPGKSGLPHRSAEHLPSVDALLLNQTVSELLHDYMGGTVRYDGLITLHISDGIDEDNYPSALWHHDRCGRRLKLFIFLHNVAADGRPTQVARGTANTVYYYLAEPWALTSRYNDSYIQSHFETIDMTGPAGGGFIFDTNSLHRGVVVGNRPRRTVVLEFHGHGKLPRAFHSARHNACPSVKHKTWRTGTPGYSLYPPEDVHASRNNGQHCVPAGKF